MASDERRHRLQTLATENRRRQQRPERLRHLSEAIDGEPSTDDVLALQAAERLWRVVEDQAKFHLVRHRLWGDRLAGEASRTLREIAGKLEAGIDAYLLWSNPPEAVRVPVAPLLRHTAEHLSPQTYLTLVSGDTKSGLVLGWDHLADADEYSLLTWGDFAFDLTR